MNKAYSQVDSLNTSGNYFDMINSLNQKFVHDTVEASAYYQYHRFFEQANAGMYPHGNANIVGQKIYQYTQNFNNPPINLSTSAITFVPHWTPIGTVGMVADYYGTQLDKPSSGQMHRICFDPDYNIGANKTIYAASSFGGLWETTDDGASWHTTGTDNELPMTATSDVAVAYSNNHSTKYIYVCTGNSEAGVPITYTPNWGFVNPIFTQGIYRKINNGPWQAINTGFLNLFNGTGTARRIVVHPTNPDIVFVATTSGIFRSLNATTTGTWTMVFDGLPGFIDKEFRGLAFKPGTPNTIYASGKNIYRSTDGGTTWANITTAYGFNLNNLINGFKVTRINIETTKDNPDVLWANIHGYEYVPTSPVNYIYKFTANNNTWVQKKYHTGYYSEAWCPIAVSPINEDEVFIGGNLSDNVIGFNPNTSSWYGAYGYGFAGSHADQHDLKYTPNPPYTSVFSANDGGISKKTIAGYNSIGWTPLINGFHTNCMWAFDDCDVNSDYIGVALQDNDVQARRQNGTTTQWYAPFGLFLDGTGIGFEDDDKTHMYFQRGFSVNIAHYNYTNNMSTSEAKPENLIQTFKTLNHPTTDNFIIGFSELQRKVGNGNGVSWVQESDICKSGLASWQRQIIDFTIAPSNTQYVYIATNGADNDGTQNWDLEPHLFRSTTGTNNGVGLNCNFPVGKFIDITANLPKTTVGNIATPVITSIAVSSTDHLKLWVASACCETGKHIAYSSNGGNTFTNADPNNSLPDVPVNAVVYQDGSNDRVYIGTDVGVYTRDASDPTWYKYENIPTADRFPNVRVVDMKINKCSGKLRVGTFGRGLWEGDLIPVDGWSALNTIITVNTTYTGTKNMKGNIIIEPGVKLTVTGTVNMPATGKIIVKRGANLTLDGGILANACHAMWKGVELWGTSNLAQQSPWVASPIGAQGWVEMKNNAKIKNARDGIYTIKNNTDGTQDWNYTGGVIQAVNSEFINNRRDVGFLSYHVPTGLDINKSYFNNCTFKTDQVLQDINYADCFGNYFAAPAHLTMYDVNGIKVRGCTFKTFTANYNFHLAWRSAGILSYEAGYEVIALGADRNIFENLTIGIEAHTFTGYTTLRVSGSDFNNTQQSILSDAGPSFINDNTFNSIPINTITIPCTALSYQPFGIYMYNAHYFNIISNTFNATGGNFKTSIGVDLHHSSTYGGNVRFNTFNALQWGVQTEFNNSALNISCNTFNANTEAWSINPQSINGILKDQGTGCGNFQVRAGNSFNFGGTVDIHNYLTTSWTYHAWGFPLNTVPTKNGGFVLNNCLQNTNDLVSCTPVPIPCDPACADALLITYNYSTDPEARAGMKQRLLDSYSAYARDSNLISFLNNDSTLEAKKLLVGVYIKRREGANATTAMAAIPNTGTENTKFRNFYNIFINLINNNKRFDQLSSVQRETVISISTTTTDVSANAQAYLDWLNGTRTVRVPEQGVPVRKGAITEDAWLQSNNYNLQSIPNPVNGNETNVRCFVPIGKQGVIIVYNKLGEKQMQITLHEGINDALIDVSQLTKGVYPFVLTIDNAKVASNKIIKL